MMHESQWMGEGPQLERATVRRLRSASNLDVLSVQPADDRAQSWTWSQLLGSILVVLLFTSDLGYHFASLQWNHLPASQRINDGSQPTFFAFHTNPYCVFSED